MARHCKWASIEGHDAVAQRLLELGLDVDTHGGEYGNVLQAASASGHNIIVQKLLEFRADVNA
jgi:hypothetical protein